ncbi:hypothetical protein [Peterkaempfera bronchialis]|uniref:hypothetical protein n=1 Tax=Peterkaempfera bronchialis TaxID=2126346 RepID=UPI0013B460CD|nr:hypothetical protein [Peterkaempfera bronchialis]
MIELSGGRSREREGEREVSPDHETDGEQHLDLDPLPPGEELPRLMARFGRLLEQYDPGDVVVMSREEYDRREAAAYAGGWQDAAEEHRQHIAAARWEGWLGRWRPLRVVGGPGDVIPFPAGRRLEEPNGVPTGGADAGEAAEEQRAPQRGAPPRTPSVKPSLSPKSRRSKSPTIPRLAPPTRKPRPAGETPGDAAD